MLEKIVIAKTVRRIEPKFHSFISTEIIEKIIEDIPDRVDYFEYKLNRPYEGIKRQLRTKWLNGEQKTPTTTE